MGVSYGELMHEAGYLKSDEYHHDHEVTFSRIIVNGEPQTRHDLIKHSLGIKKIPFGNPDIEVLIETNRVDADHPDLVEHIYKDAEKDELTILLYENRYLTYRGVDLSVEDRKRILDMLKVLFPDRQ
ncbi:hypothetical protein BBD42_27060 [Paenibacillus sp. BIHB 4019]|uniref:Uncharacterized protein n=1 Tax=Paenibacillus sp. BIHB 4019 TaxID=1870819 RepID=A0A1B2DPV1_9BACL|nr:hypothetical protein BBD42_27060 [Paenibacillus sp. BIHB 4019]